VQFYEIVKSLQSVVMTTGNIDHARRFFP